METKEEIKTEPQEKVEEKSHFLKGIPDKKEYQGNVLGEEELFEKEEVAEEQQYAFEAEDIPKFSHFPDPEEEEIDKNEPPPSNEKTRDTQKKEPEKESKFDEQAASSIVDIFIPMVVGRIGNFSYKFAKIDTVNLEILFINAKVEAKVRTNLIELFEKINANTRLKLDLPVELINNLIGAAKRYFEWKKPDVLNPFNDLILAFVTVAAVQVFNTVNLRVENKVHSEEICKTHGINVEQLKTNTKQTLGNND